MRLPLSWSDLNEQEKEMAIQQYRCIRAEEEQISEENVDISLVENCSFERKIGWDNNTYIEILI